MNNQQVDKDFLTRLKGAYQAKYGFEMDEWTSVILNEISENFSKYTKEAKASIGEIEKASQLIKGQINPIYFSNEQQAYWYGAGKNTPIGIAAIIIGVLCYVIISNTLEYKELKSTVANFSKYRILMENGVIEEQKGNLYLSLNKHKENVDSVQIGREFFLSNDKEVVWIPLGHKQE